MSASGSKQDQKQALSAMLASGFKQDEKQLPSWFEKINADLDKKYNELFNKLGDFKNATRPLSLAYDPMYSRARLQKEVSSEIQDKASQYLLEVMQETAALLSEMEKNTKAFDLYKFTFTTQKISEIKDAARQLILRFTQWRDSLKQMVDADFKAIKALEEKADPAKSDLQHQMHMKFIEKYLGYAHLQFTDKKERGLCLDNKINFDFTAYDDASLLKKTASDLKESGDKIVAIGANVADEALMTEANAILGEAVRIGEAEKKVAVDRRQFYKQQPALQELPLKVLTKDRIAKLDTLLGNMSEVTAEYLDCATNLAVKSEDCYRELNKKKERVLETIAFNLPEIESALNNLRDVVRKIQDNQLTARAALDVASYPEMIRNHERLNKAYEKVQIILAGNGLEKNIKSYIDAYKKLAADYGVEDTESIAELQRQIDDIVPDTVPEPAKRCFMNVVLDIKVDGLVPTAKRFFHNNTSDIKSNGIALVSDTKTSPSPVKQLTKMMVDAERLLDQERENVKTYKQTIALKGILHFLTGIINNADFWSGQLNTFWDKIKGSSSEMDEMQAVLHREDLSAFNESRVLSEIIEIATRKATPPNTGFFSKPPTLAQRFYHVVKDINISSFSKIGSDPAKIINEIRKKLKTIPDLVPSSPVFNAIDATNMDVFLVDKVNAEPVADLDSPVVHLDLTISPR